MQHPVFDRIALCTCTAVYRAAVPGLLTHNIHKRSSLMNWTLHVMSIITCRAKLIGGHVGRADSLYTNQHAVVSSPSRRQETVHGMQALVRERMNDWGKGLCARLGKKMVELTGDYTPDLRALLSADIIICTPEKWDGISRNWQNRTYVQKVCLLVIDEIHLLGADR